MLEAALLGLGTGALVGAIALAVVLTHRGSGVVDFSAAAMAMYAAYVCDGLRREGQLFLPPLPNPLALVPGVDLPTWPVRISVGGPMAFAPALAVTLGVMAVLGLLIHLLVFRPLLKAPPLAKVVASVGLLIVAQAIVILRFGATPRPVRPILAKSPLHLPGGITVPQDQVVLAAIVVLLAVVLWAVYRFTRFGLATRAASENQPAAVVLGFSPDVLAGTNFVVSTLVVSALGVLVATVNGSIDPVTITLLIVPALGAALLGGFASFGIAVGAGLGIAMGQSVIQYWSTQDWFPHAGVAALPGVKEALPFVVIVVALALRGRSLPSRGTPGADRLPFAPRPVRVGRSAVALVAATSAGLLLLGPDWRLAITNSIIGVVLCLSLVVLTGFVGQISLAQMTLAGVSGFTLAKLAGEHGVPFPIGPLAGALVATLFGLLAALPALRVRGVNLAVVTLAAAVAIESLVFENPAWSGGLEGARVPAPRFLGLHFGPNDSGSLDGKLPNPWFGIFCLAVAAALALGVVHLRRSALGRRMLAVRANERAAAAAGVSVAGTKLLAFAMAAFIAGIGGALSGYRFGSVTPLTFGSLASVTLLAFAYLGGISSVTGAVLGGVLVAGGVGFTALDQWFGVGDEYTLFLGGLGLVVTAVLNPEGVAGALGHARARLTRPLRHSRQPARRIPTLQLSRTAS
jgi:branched-chain amino acid transport system permease protein